MLTFTGTTQALGALGCCCNLGDARMVGTPLDLPYWRSHWAPHSQGQSLNSLKASLAQGQGSTWVQACQARGHAHLQHHQLLRLLQLQLHCLAHTSQLWHSLGRKGRRGGERGEKEDLTLWFSIGLGTGARGLHVSHSSTLMADPSAGGWGRLLTPLGWLELLLSGLLILSIIFSLLE